MYPRNGPHLPKLSRKNSKSTLKKTEADVSRKRATPGKREYSPAPSSLSTKRAKNVETPTRHNPNQTGFGAVSSILNNRFHDLSARKPCSPSSSIGQAVMHLKTSFHEPTKKVGKCRENTPRSGATTRLTSPLPQHSDSPVSSSLEQSNMCEEATVMLDLFLEERSAQSQGEEV